MVTPEALDRTVSFLKTLSWGWMRLKETCLPFYRYAEKETVLFPFRESLSLRVWVTISGLPFPPPLPFFLFLFLNLSLFAGRAVTLARLLRRWYLLPPRTRWAACTWPRSLSRIHLFRRVPTSDSPAWWWWSKTLASRGSCGFRTLWKPVDSYLLGLIDVPGSVIGMFMSVISVISCSSCAVSPSYIWQNGVQTAYVSRVQTVRGRTEFKSNLDPIPKPGGWGWRYRPHLCPEDTMSWKKKKNRCLEPSYGWKKNSPWSFWK